MVDNIKYVLVEVFKKVFGSLIFIFLVIEIYLVNYKGIWIWVVVEFGESFVILVFRVFWYVWIVRLGSDDIKDLKCVVEMFFDFMS